VIAAVAGSAGNLPSGTVLSFASAIAGVAAQTAVVNGNSLTDGQDLETIDSWRARILARIRQRGGGGSAGDYQQWASEVLQGAVTACISSPGIVNVVLAVMLPGVPARAPTETELGVVTAYLQDATARKPLGMTVLVTPATLVPVNLNLTMNPDTAAIEAGAATAAQAYFNAAATIGGTLHMSMLDAALSNASGETSHDRLAPAANDITFTPTQLPILGTITFTPASP
jgi:uncharacterized phage protein gp47/JayE